MTRPAPGARLLARLSAALVLSLSFALPSGLAVAQPVSTTRPSPRPPLDTTGLQEALDALTGGYGVGAVAQVVGPGGRWSSASGVRRLEDPSSKARAQDRVRIASVTKSMIATLVLQEVERGRWSLSTTVDDVLPGLLPGHGDVTLDQLLSHRSGAPDYLVALLATATTAEAFREVIERPYTDRQLVAASLTLPWAFAPGTDYGYSNTNYVVVGMMLARITHRPVSALLRHRIFRAAGMEDSGFPRSPKIRGRHLTEYAYLDGPFNLSGFNASIFSSAGAVVSTARDVNRFYRALLRGRLLSPSLVREMMTSRTEESAYGLGIFSLPDPCPAADGSGQLVYGHTGGSFGTTTLAFSSPDARRQLAVAVTGRSYDAAAEPLPLEEFAVAALLASCPNPPTTTQQRQTAPVLGIPDLDRGATEVPLRR